MNNEMIIKLKTDNSFPSTITLFEDMSKIISMFNFYIEKVPNQQYIQYSVYSLQTSINPLNLI